MNADFVGKSHNVLIFFVICAGCVKFLSPSLCGILSLLIPEGIPSPAFE